MFDSNEMMMHVAVSRAAAQDAYDNIGKTIEHMGAMGMSDDSCQGLTALKKIISAVCMHTYGSALAAMDEIDNGGFDEELAKMVASRISSIIKCGFVAAMNEDGWASEDDMLGYFQWFGRLVDSVENGGDVEAVFFGAKTGGDDVIGKLAEFLADRDGGEK